MPQADEPTSSEAADAAVADLERQAAVAEVNAEIRAFGDRVFPFDAFDTRFWCECGDELCHEPVLLSLRRFDELRRVGDPLLAEGHPIERARELRQQARELRADAEALRAEAMHQLRRACRLGGRDLGGGWT
jgi:hypothetical protein